MPECTPFKSYRQNQGNWDYLNPDFEAYGCGVCCCASIATYKERIDITPAVLKNRGVFTSTDMTTIWNNTSSQFSFGSAECQNDLAAVLAEIRNQIDTYRDPVVVRVWGNSNGTKAHYVVAYGYTGNGMYMSPANILVMDPLKGKTTLATTMNNYPIFKYIYRIY